MLGADGRAIELEPATSLEDAVDDGLREILVVEHGSPGIGVLVAGEDHRAPAAVAVVDDVVQHVGGIGSVSEIADLVNHKDVGRDVARKSLGETALTKRRRKIIDELGGGDEERVE